MKSFIGEDFLLQSDTARRLFHDYAEKMPIFDYHCHIPPRDISGDRRFSNLTDIWLRGDHYKWRAMRSNGIAEEYITGQASDWDKFLKWAETVPYLLRNPVYHWTHLELKRYFDIDLLLGPDTAREIWERCNEKLAQPEFACRKIIEMSNVDTICTTDDPVDSLEHHRRIRSEWQKVKVYPAWRPDKAMLVENAKAYNNYLDRLAESANCEISNYDSLISALEKRHQFFHEHGARLSDHGIETVFADDFRADERDKYFAKVRSGKELAPSAASVLKSSLLLDLALMDHSRGWTQQFHLGALRNNNTRMFLKLGADTGFDSIGDLAVALPLSRFLDKLDRQGKLAKTILYNINPRDNAVIASMLGNFQDGSIPGKIQFGSGWWFMDQKHGIEDQLNALSNMGLLSRFVGMLTDSRSFLSYARHEYFRRILCNILGQDVENGELPRDFALLGQMVQDICFYNAKRYFAFPE